MAGHTTGHVVGLSIGQTTGHFTGAQAVPDSVVDFGSIAGPETDTYDGGTVASPSPYTDLGGVT